MPFNILFPTSGDSTAGWMSICENPDTEEVALTKRSDRVIDRVAPFITRGLGGAIVDDTSSRVEFEVSKAAGRGWESSKVDIVVGFEVEVWEEMETEVAASSLAGGALRCVIGDDISSKGELFDA